MILSFVCLAGGILWHSFAISISHLLVFRRCLLDCCGQCSGGVSIRWTLTVYHSLFPELDCTRHTGQTCLYLQFGAKCFLDNYGDKDICMCLVGCSLEEKEF